MMAGFGSEYVASFESEWVAGFVGIRTAVALANKTARIAWKMMMTDEPYDPRRHGAAHAAAPRAEAA
jgi:hypothetical protein